MAKIFVSYSHDIRDRRLAYFLVDFLEARGHDVFIDREIRVGDDWARTIERELEACEAFVVLLSDVSVERNFVRAEVTVATRRSRPPLILPIWVALENELPLLFKAYLEQIQAVIWKGPDDDEEVAKKLAERLAAAPAAGGSAAASAAPPAVSGFPPREERGPVRLDSEFYVSRSADLRLESLIHNRGVTVRIRGRRQMGKSSLLGQALSTVRKSGYPLCYLDLRGLDAARLSTLDSLAMVIARSVERRLKAGEKPEDHWDDVLGPGPSLTSFVEEAVLARAEGCHFLVIDHVDKVLEHPYKADFFNMLRSWEGEQGRGSPWSRLNLVLGYSMEPHLWIAETTSSDFNVGIDVKLYDFSFEQVMELNGRYRGGLKTEKAVRELYDYVGGQPFLVRQALFCAAHHGWSMREIKQQAALFEGPFQGHLGKFPELLQRSASLQRSLKQVMKQGMCDDLVDFHRLSSTGLICDDGGKNKVRLRYEVYRDHLARIL